jgi:hypothetical protein
MRPSIPISRATEERLRQLREVNEMITSVIYKLDLNHRQQLSYSQETRFQLL